MRALISDINIFAPVSLAPLYASTEVLGQKYAMFSLFLTIHKSLLCNQRQVVSYPAIG